MKLHLQPSENHRHLLPTPALRYDGGAFAPWKRKLTRKLAALVGDMPAEKTPLNTRTIWSRKHPLGRIEKIAFTSEPRCDVPAYVCLPDSARPPYRFLICLQGHSSGMHNSIRVDKNEKEPFKVNGDRDFAIACMQNGFGALCIEQRAFGERKDDSTVAPHDCHHPTMQALMLGRTLLGERIWDVDRGLDYLASRGDADMKNVGVMGNSGGGTVSIYASALLPRIAFAMPSCSFCTFEDSIFSIYHCMDNYVPGILKYADMADIMGLFAPKPLVIVAGKQDAIFPIKGVRKAFRDLQKIYAAAGAEDQCKLVIGPEGHRFYADAGWKALLKLIG